MPIIIKCLSLYDPWAWAMGELLKLIETRSWDTAYRGWLGIHAAKLPVEWAIRRSFKDNPDREKLFREMLAEKGWTPEKATPGKMVCIIDLNLIIPTELCSANISNQEFLFGNYARGRKAWKQRKSNHVDLRPFGLEARGAQRLFNWTVPPDVEKLLSQKTPTSTTLF